MVNAAISFAVVPLFLALLTETAFGIWLTVSAVISWFNFFDLGMGNGLRNRFAEALARGDHILARTYVSTTYFAMAGIALTALLLFLTANVWIDWATLFNAPVDLSEQVQHMVPVLVVLFVPQFVLQLIKMVATADQRPAVANALNTLVNVLQLLAVWVLDKVEAGSLVIVAAVMGAINAGVPLAANVWLFAGRYRPYAPALRHVAWHRSRDLLGLGFTFFVLQGAALVVFTTDNLIISRVLGPEEVPAYNISFRYFNLALVFFALVTNPFWSAFTDAWTRGDTTWIKRMLRNLLLLWGGVSLGVLAMWATAPRVIAWWVGTDIAVSPLLNAAMAFWVVAASGLSIFATFLSGVGKLRLSLYQAVVVMVLNIPLSVYLAGTGGLGSAGVMLATLACTLLRLAFQPMQTWLLITGKAQGIWNR